MKPLKLMLALGAAASTAAVAAALSRGTGVSMHELDWLDGAGVTAARRYRSLGHMLHHVRELAGVAVPAARVYVLRAISPAFREQVMIVTAMSNACPA